MTNIYEIIENDAIIYWVSGDDVSFAVVSYLTDRRKMSDIYDIGSLSVRLMSEEELMETILEHGGDQMSLYELSLELEDSEVIAVNVVSLSEEPDDEENLAN